MRCNNCGWLNSDEDSRCVKCNSPLTPAKREEPGVREGAAPEVNSQETAASQPGSMAGPESRGPDRSVVGVIPCPVCDYPANGRVQNCPMYGSSLKGEQTLPPFREQDQPPPPPFREQDQLPPLPQPKMMLERLGARPEDLPTPLSFTATDGDVNVNRQDLDQNN